MFDVTQVITKKLSLPIGWADNNYEGYYKYVEEDNRLQKAISDMLVHQELEVVQIEMEISITVKSKDTTINTSDLVEHITLQVNE